MTLCMHRKPHQPTSPRRLPWAPKWSVPMRLQRLSKARAHGARLVYVDGEPEAAWIQEGTVRALFVFSTKAARITNMSVIMEPPALGAMRVSFVEDKTWKCIP